MALHTAVEGTSKRGGAAKVAMVSVLLLGASAVSAAPFSVIDDAGNLAGTYVQSSTAGTPTFQFGQTVGGLGAATFSFDVRNQGVTLSSNTPRPVLQDNTIISAELYVDVTEVVHEWDFGGSVGVVDHVVRQGINRMAITFRNPDGGAQERMWAGAQPLSDPGMEWFPATAQAWTGFTWDLTQESWWDAKYATWEVFRVEFNENDNIPPGATNDEFSNSYAIRNLQFAAVPEPASLSAIGAGLGAMLLRRRR